MVPEWYRHYSTCWEEQARTDSISLGQSEMWTAWSRLGLKQWDRCQRKQRIRKQATDIERDYSAYSECTNNYKPTVAFPLITCSGMPLHVHKIGSTCKIEMQFLNLDPQIGTFSLQDLTLNFDEEFIFRPPFYLDCERASQEVQTTDRNRSK